MRSAPRPAAARCPAGVLLGLALLAGAGCAGAGPLASLDPLGGVPATPPEPAAVASTDTTETPPPPVEPPAFAATAAPIPPAPSAGGGGKHDAATSVLIAEELALAPAADRAALAAEWAALDATMVEQVIRIRRMVRQLDAEPPASAAAAPVPATPTAEGPDPFAPAETPGVVPAVVPAVAPAAPAQVPATAEPAGDGGPMYDPNVRPAAYRIPPADRTPPSPLFPGVPLNPAARPPAAQPPTTPPPAAPPTPTRTAEVPSAAFLSPGAAATGSAPDPGPTGFGPAYAPGPDATRSAQSSLVPPPLNAAGDPDAATDYRDRLDDLIAAARRRERRLAEVAATAADPDARAVAEASLAETGVHLRMLHLIAGDHGRAIEAVSGLPPAEQEFWQHVLWGLSSELDERSIPDPADRATQAVAALRTAANRLSAEAKLTLRNVNFCHRVDSFGNAVRFDRDEFTPDQPVLIYAEVENFTSEQTLEGRYRTVLRSKVEIFKAGGDQLIETLPLDQPITVDLCDRHRQDYFQIYDLKIPSRIGLGPHVMKLTVEDTQGNQIAETRLNFTVK